MSDAWSATVNGAAVRTDVPDDERLLDTLRWRLGLRGTKEGCRTGDCGACTVLLDGRPTLSCLVLTRELDAPKIQTIEGAADDPQAARVVAAFAAENAVQCGYCTPGFVLALTGLLNRPGPAPSTAELLSGLQGNLCRCTGYATIVRAVERARATSP